jgi:hypothetical protein
MKVLDIGMTRGVVWGEVRELRDWKGLTSKSFHAWVMYRLVGGWEQSVITLTGIV